MSNTQLKKLELLEWLAGLQDQKLIDELMNWKESHRRVSIEQYNRELEEANARIDAGEYVTHEEVKKESKSWISRK
jgi:predicted transcriptional regulator